MNTLIRTELLKQRTLRTHIVGATAAPVVAGLVTVAVLSTAGKDGNDPLSSESLNQVIGAPVGVITVIALILGVIGMAGEYRHETITNTFLATPRRRDVVVSKLGAYLITGAAMALASLVVTMSIALPWLSLDGIDLAVGGETVRIALGGLCSTALYGALGVSIGAVIRNQTAACAVVLTWLLAVEGLLGDMFSGSEFLRWLPVATGEAIVRTSSGSEFVAAPIGVVVFAAYVALFSIIATRLTVQRDVT